MVYTGYFDECRVLRSRRRNQDSKNSRGHGMGFHEQMCAPVCDWGSCYAEDFFRLSSKTEQVGQVGIYEQDKYACQPLARCLQL